MESQSAEERVMDDAPAVSTVEESMEIDEPELKAEASSSQSEPVEAGPTVESPTDVKAEIDEALATLEVEGPTETTEVPDVTIEEVKEPEPEVKTDENPLQSELVTTRPTIESPTAEVKGEIDEAQATPTVEEPREATKLPEDNADTDAPKSELGTKSTDVSPRKESLKVEEKAVKKEPQLPMVDATGIAESLKANPCVPSTTPQQPQSGLTIGKHDILFGRGGLTNRHFGNIKYRDVINANRLEYVKACKVDKPKVARRVVKQILSDTFTPVRFLKRDENGLWVEVDENEAAHKVSQALREKSRWSCMKGDLYEEGYVVPSVAELKHEVKLTVEHAMESSLGKKKRGFTGGGENVVKVLKVETKDKETGATKVKTIKVGKAKATNQKPVKANQVKMQSSPLPPQPYRVPDIKPIDFPITIPNSAAINVPPLEASASSVTLLCGDGSLPNDADVLFGRGGRTNHHPGNKRLRMIVDQFKDAYEMSRKSDKPRFSKAIVKALREHPTPSRFLRINETTNQWEDVGDKRAAEKVSQTLREKEKNRAVERNLREAAI